MVGSKDDYQMCTEKNVKVKMGLFILLKQDGCAKKRSYMTLDSMYVRSIQVIAFFFTFRYCNKNVQSLLKSF